MKKKQNRPVSRINPEAYQIIDAIREERQQGDELARKRGKVLKRKLKK
jgi:hypothetical protein